MPSSYEDFPQPFLFSPGQNHIERRPPSPKTFRCHRTPTANRSSWLWLLCCLTATREEDICTVLLRRGEPILASGASVLVIDCLRGASSGTCEREAPDAHHATGQTDQDRRQGTSFSLVDCIKEPPGDDRVAPGAEVVAVEEVGGVGAYFIVRSSEINKSSAAVCGSLVDTSV